MTSPEQVTAYISLGSNINPLRNLQAAVNRLRAHGTITAISSVYQTPPYGETDQPDFLDVVVALVTAADPALFKTQTLRGIEDALGRTRDPRFKYGPLTLDMDIMLWGDHAFDFGDKPWHVPHQGITRYAADALPLAEIAPQFIHPETGETLTQIAARLDATGITRTSLRIV